jgi:thioredoxin 1
MKLTNEANFQEDVLNKNFIVVDFYADWCGPCRVIAPFLEEIQMETNVEIVKVNIDESPGIASQYNIMSIPVLAIFKNGEKVSINVGAASKARIIAWIESYRE